MTDTTKGERIAFRSTRGEGVFAKRRWTELAVYYDAAAFAGRCFIAEAVGRSSIEGEKPLRTVLATDDLERTLYHFADGEGRMSTPGRMVAEQARLWVERQGVQPAAAPTYSERQREAAIDAFQTLLVGAVIDDDRQDAGQAVDAVAGALGLRRAAAHG